MIKQISSTPRREPTAYPPPIALKEMLPHRFTYIIPLEGYDNIPFYSSFQAIDTAKGTFHEQFKENPYPFAPEIGRHDLYDAQFNPLASRQSTNFTDGFQPLELARIDQFLDAGEEIGLDQKSHYSHGGVFDSPPFPPIG